MHNVLHTCCWQMVTSLQVGRFLDAWYWYVILNFLWTRFCFLYLHSRCWKLHMASMKFHLLFPSFFFFFWLFSIVMVLLHVPDIWQWSELTSYGDLPSPRDFAAASAIGNRKIVMWVFSYDFLDSLFLWGWFMHKVVVGSDSTKGLCSSGYKAYINRNAME